MDTRPLPYLIDDTPWMSTVRQFLHDANSQIDIHKPWLTRPLRHDDRFLMEIFL